MEQLFFLHSQSLNSASPNLFCCLRSVLNHDPSGCWPGCLYRESGAGKHKVRECWGLMEQMDSSVERCFKMDWKYPRMGGGGGRDDITYQTKLLVLDSQLIIIFTRRGISHTNTLLLFDQQVDTRVCSRWNVSRRKLSIDHPGLLTLLMDSSSLLPDVRVQTVFIAMKTL